MGRRSKEQICSDYRKERGKLYSRRTRALKKLQNPKFKGQQRIDLQKQYDKTQNKLEVIRDYLFKCGKKFAKLGKQREALRQHQYYLLRKVKSGTLTKAQVHKANKEMRRTAEVINDVETAMRLPIGEMKRGKTGFKAIKGGSFKEDGVLWELPANVDSWIDSGYFATLILDGTAYKLSNQITARVQVDAAYHQAFAWQHINPSPHYFAYGDIQNGVLELFVLDYTPQLYEMF